MKTSILKSAALMLLASVAVVGASHATEPAQRLGANKQPVTVSPGMASAVMQMAPTCPAPYMMSTQGFDTSKGEFECIKTAATCPDAYDSIRNDATGQLQCKLKQIPPAPPGWAPGTGGGALVYESIPQPMIACPKSTPTWQWGTFYWKDSWNRMGCRANFAPTK